FGIAKPLIRSAVEPSAETMPLQRLATPAYASPEQLQGDKAHTGMDVFSLGVVLHEVTTGHRPWLVDADDKTGIGVGRFLTPSVGIARQMTTAAENGLAASGASIRPRDVEGDLDAIILKALDGDVRCRY